MKNLNVLKKTKLALFAITSFVLIPSMGYAQTQNSGTDNSGTVASAIGFETIATGDYSTAIGYKTRALGNNSFSAGNLSRAAGENSFAFGKTAVANSTYSMAFGRTVTASANNAIVMGSGWGAIPILNNIENSLMIGFNSTKATFFVGPSSGVGTIGKVGIGTTTPSSNLEIHANSNPNFIISNRYNKRIEIGVATCAGCFSPFSEPGDAVVKVLGGGNLIFAIPGIDEDREISFHTGGEKVMTIKEFGSTGKVAIGTTEFPDMIGPASIDHYRLFVEGGILTKELRVRTVWADYVFFDDYALTPLSEVESYIQENGHLSNVPSAEQVEEEGIELGEMTRIQQEKIEELTLYLIQMQKEIDALKSRLDKQEEE